jgi:hypothetical protein
MSELGLILTQRWVYFVVHSPVSVDRKQGQIEQKRQVELAAAAPFCLKTGTVCLPEVSFNLHSLSEIRSTFHGSHS